MLFRSGALLEHTTLVTLQLLPGYTQAAVAAPAARQWSLIGHIQRAAGCFPSASALSQATPDFSSSDGASCRPPVRHPLSQPAAAAAAAALPAASCRCSEQRALSAGSESHCFGQQLPADACWPGAQTRVALVRVGLLGHGCCFLHSLGAGAVVSMRNWQSCDASMQGCTPQLHQHCSVSMCAPVHQAVRSDTFLAHAAETYHHISATSSAHTCRWRG